MKKILFISIFILGSMFSFQSLADTHAVMSVVPSSMQMDAQKMMQWKAKKIANKMMFMGMKLYIMGKIMMDQQGDQAQAKMMVANGIQLYKMGMQMNGGSGVSMRICPGRMKQPS